MTISKSQVPISITEIPEDYEVIVPSQTGGKRGNKFHLWEDCPYYANIINPFERPLYILNLDRWSICYWCKHREYKNRKGKQRKSLRQKLKENGEITND